MINKIKNKYLKLENSNYRKILIIAIPIVVVGLSVGGYFIFSDNRKEDVINPNITNPSIEEDEEVFPEIKSSDFYDLIEFENGLPFIGDKMMAAIIKDIITRLGSVDGDLSFYIVENSNVVKTIHFKWIHKEKELKKTYIISINGL